jgi:hypothetical protein
MKDSKGNGAMQVQTNRRTSVLAVIGSSCGFLVGLFGTYFLFDFGFGAGLPFAIVLGLSLTYLTASYVVRGGML